MDSVSLTNPTFWMSVAVGAIVLAAASGAWQMFGLRDEEEQQQPRKLNTKAMARDGILGAIFTAMAWTLVPDSMKSLSDSVGSGVSTAASSTASIATRARAVSGDFELQIGPPRF
jgi:hypothetical protein